MQLDRLRRDLGGVVLVDFRRRGGFGFDGAHDGRRSRVMMRARMLVPSTATAMIKAPAQARLLPVVVGAQRVLEDDQRQGGDGLGEPEPGLQAHAEILVAERGEQQRRGLAADAGEGQQARR